jgi:hypothetical protein
MECETHKKADKVETSLAKVTHFFAASGFQSDDAVLAAEGAFAFNTMKCHSSYKTADCTSVLFKTIFPDSEVAYKFSIVHTKTEVIISSVVAHHAIENVMQVFKNNSHTEELSQTQAIPMLSRCLLL